MIRALPFLLYLLLIGCHQVILSDLTSIGSATINLAALVALLVALYKSEFAALWFGFLAGFVAAAVAGSQAGWFALSLAIIAMVAFHVRQRLNLESVYSRLLVVLGGCLVVELLWLMVEQSDSWTYLILVRVLPSAVYTTVVGWVYFLFKERVVTYQKIRELF